MTRLQFSLCCVLAVAVGCKKDATFLELPPPQAAVHWVHAVPDTGEMDMRPTDIISNAGLFDAVFRGSNMFYQGIDAGTRQIRAFMSSSNPAITGTPIIDTSVTLTANTGYTMIHTGFARAGATPGRRLLVVPDAPPTLAAGKIAIRVINAAPSIAGATPAPADTTLASDVFVRSLSNITTAGTPDLTNVPYGQASGYVVLDTGSYWVGLRTTGSTGPLYAQVAVPLGTAGTTVSNPIAGSRVAGSVLTMVLLPRSVTPSTAPQGGRPASRNIESTTRSNDTVTVQSGSISRLVNRSPAAADSTVGTTGTGATTAANASDVVLVAGTTEPEYNGWQVVMAVADTLICSPVDTTAPGVDTPTRCNATNATATTRFRYRFRIAGTPTSPATGTATYRIYTPAAVDFTLPGGAYLVDRRPATTIP